MSSFLHPAMAWAALALAAIPIIIHLIHRRRLRRIDWAAMEFLLLALRRNRRRIRLEQLILLALRVALMVLIALFLARPLLDDGGLAWLASALQSEEKVFVLDDSLSMSQRQNDRSLLVRSTAALGESVRRLAERSSRDRVTILRTSRPDAPLVRSGFLDRERAAALVASFDGLRSTSTRSRLARALESIAEHATASADAVPRPRAISILGDLRASDWTDGAGQASRELQDAFAKLLDGDGPPVRFILLDSASEDSSNVALDSIDISGGRPAAGIPVELDVRVRNHGTESVRDLRVRLRYAPVAKGSGSGSAPAQENVASMVLATPIPEIAAQDSQVVRVSCTFQNAGQYWLAADVTGSADSLPEDNTLTVVLDVVEATEVLVVSGEPSSEPFEGEGDFLALALRPTGDASSGIAPLVVVEDSLPRETLDRFGAVFLLNCYSLPADFLSKVGRYVQEGGTAAIFLGDQIDGVVAARDLGTAAGPADADHPARGILPAQIGEVRVADESPVSLLPSYDHAYFRFLADGGERYIKEIGFRRYFRLEPLPRAQVIARFADGEDSPALVEMGFGEGRVLLFASSADDEWNDWCRHVTYLPVLQEILRHSGGAAARHTTYPAGAVIEVPIDITLHDARGTRYRGPDYPETPERELIASPRSAEDASSFVLRIDDTSRAGLSLLALKTRDGREELRGLAVASERPESDLRRISAEEIRKLYPDVPLTVVRDVTQISGSGRGHFEAADALLALFGLFLLVEGVLAWWFAHHQKSGAGRAQAAS